MRSTTLNTAVEAPDAERGSQNRGHGEARIAAETTHAVSQILQQSLNGGRHFAFDAGYPEAVPANPSCFPASFLSASGV